MTVNRALLERLSKSAFCVDPCSLEDVTLYCLLSGIAHKQSYFAGCQQCSTTLHANNGVTHISFCVNKQYQ